MKKLFLLLTAVLCFTVATAHPGGTDGKGGHYDRTTGAYHYHHGYEAHQHTGGVCPYDYDDRTGESSGPPPSSKSDASISGNFLIAAGGAAGASALVYGVGKHRKK